MANDFKRTEGTSITKKDALDWIDRYDHDHRKDKKETKSVFYGRDIIEKILKQEGCTGISFFLASKHSEYAQKNTIQLVLVGTTEDGTLLWPEESAKDGNGGGTAANAGLTCPPYCPK